jgi:hypothetical protein
MLPSKQKDLPAKAAFIVMCFAKTLSSFPEYRTKSYTIRYPTVSAPLDAYAISR